MFFGTKRLCVGPDMEREIRSSDSVVGGVKEGGWIYEDTGNGHGDEEGCEDMSSCVSPIASQDTS